MIVSLLKQRMTRKWLAYRRLRLGKKGEDLACKFLRRQGFYVWKRNWRCRLGELDIIAYNDSQLRLIEVKTRALKHSFDFPAIEAIDQQKLKRLEKLSHSFLLKHSKAMRVRRLTSFAIDAITVQIPEGIFASPIITHIHNSGDGFNFTCHKQQRRQFL